MILTELKLRLDVANQWVMDNAPPRPANVNPGELWPRSTLWTRPIKTAICIALRAAWGDGVSIYASEVGHRDISHWCYDPQQEPRNMFNCLPEGDPSRAAHHRERKLLYGLGRYDISCLRYEQQGSPILLLAAESELAGRNRVQADFDNLSRSAASFKVMVYDYDYEPIPKLISRIDPQNDGTYLFAAFQNRKIIYREVTP